jgi:hypothetical protein
MWLLVLDHIGEVHPDTVVSRVFDADTIEKEQASLKPLSVLVAEDYDCSKNKQEERITQHGNKGGVTPNCWKVIF